MFFHIAILFRIFTGDFSEAVMIRFGMIIFTFTALFAPFAAYAGNNATESVADTVSVEQAVADTSFVIEVDRAYPMSGRSVILNDTYSVSVADGRVVSRLPYFGRAYSIPYGGGEGLMFEAEIEGYVCRHGRRDTVEVEFSAQTREDRFEFRISLFPNGNANISVTSTNRQPISYGGELESAPAAE